MNQDRYPVMPQLIADGTRLRMMLERRKMQQREFARRMGAQDAQVSRWITGRAVFHIEDRIKACRILNCLLIDLGEPQLHGNGTDTCIHCGAPMPANGSRVAFDPAPHLHSVLTDPDIIKGAHAPVGLAESATELWETNHGHPVARNFRKLLAALAILIPTTAFAAHYYCPQHHTFNNHQHVAAPLLPERALMPGQPT